MSLIDKALQYKATQDQAQAERRAKERQKAIEALQRDILNHVRYVLDIRDGVGTTELGVPIEWTLDTPTGTPRSAAAQFDLEGLSFTARSYSKSGNWPSVYVTDTTGTPRYIAGLYDLAVLVKNGTVKPAPQGTSHENWSRS